MADFIPTEGINFLAALAVDNVDTDRGAGLDLVLFTNAGLTATATAAGLTQPTGTGYAPITLADASWTGAAASRVYAKQEWTAGAGGFSADIEGWAIVTKGTTPRILAMGTEDTPYTMSEGNKYAVTPTIQFSDVS